RLAMALQTAGQPERALDAYRRALETRRRLTAMAPSDAGGQNSLAWFLATCPESELRDPPQAVAAAQKAVEMAPKNGSYWGPLGTAYYRTGDWKAALSALEKAGALRDGGTGSEWFFLAMTHWQLGQKVQAHEWYKKAVQWMDTNQPCDPEQRIFRAEAGALL